MRHIHFTGFSFQWTLLITYTSMSCKTLPRLQIKKFMKKTIERSFPIREKRTYSKSFSDNLGMKPLSRRLQKKLKVIQEYELINSSKFTQNYIQFAISDHEFMVNIAIHFFGTFVAAKQY